MPRLPTVVMESIAVELCAIRIGNTGKKVQQMLILLWEQLSYTGYTDNIMVPGIYSGVVLQLISHVVEK